MTDRKETPPPRDSLPPPRPAELATSELVEQGFNRASGAPLVKGNAVRVLKDGAENYPAWFAAMRAAKKSILFENYIIEDDAVGKELAEVLCERARAGVTVRLVRDWLGSWSGTSRRYWRSLRHAGVEVRGFNPPRLDSPLGWLTRDHRKTIAIDGEIAFVTGLCVSQRWLGDEKRGTPPWRDTGVEIRGPAVAYVERAFAEVWALTGHALPADAFSDPAAMAEVGDVPVRIVAGAPKKAGLFRLDQLIASAARRTLWLTDAYFVGFAPYVQSLCAAAQDNVDVRLLVPSASDLPLIASFSRAGYRPLIEAGVRVFEWNGSMVHAKTAVADGRWARVGSSNLNIASFVSNYEIDVAMEHEGLARKMEEMYLADLENATEIVIDPRRRRVVPDRKTAPRTEPEKKGPRGASGRAVGAVRFAHAVGSVVSRRRALGFVQSSLMAAFGGILVAVAAVAVLWPRVVAMPLAVLAAWLGLAMIVNAIRLRLSRRQPRRKHKRTRSRTKSGAHRPGTTAPTDPQPPS
ncbi:MAG TPA: phospholipase D-like domain-containing protein [Polyangia bacterium]|jgi:cardiolipin synthase